MEKTNTPAIMEAMPRSRSRDGSWTAMWVFVDGCLLMMLIAIVVEGEPNASGRHALGMRPECAAAGIHQL